MIQKYNINGDDWVSVTIIIVVLKLLYNQTNINNYYWVR